jgi:hypothetical protein
MRESICQPHRRLASEWRERIYTKANNSIQKQAKYLNRHFSKENTQMVNKHRKKCSELLMIREMERKMEGKCNHLTPIGIAITKKQTSRAW